MTGFNFNPPNFNQQQVNQLQQQGGGGGATPVPPAPQQPAQAPATAPTQPLPPTGLDQQLASLNQRYAEAQAGGGTGFGRAGYNVRASQFQQAQLEGGGELEDLQFGTSSLDAMARNLAQRYGLAIGKGRLVDDEGNFLVMPDQLAAASGGAMTEGEAAAKMNFISQALTNRRNEMQQKKGMAALQTGLGQIQSRGRGSMAALTSGYYQDIANMAANQEYAATDFSYYIEAERLKIAETLQRRQERLMKKQARGQFLTGIGTTIVGLYSGNLALTGYGLSQVGGSAGSTGWF